MNTGRIRRRLLGVLVATVVPSAIVALLIMLLGNATWSEQGTLLVGIVAVSLVAATVAALVAVRSPETGGDLPPLAIVAGGAAGAATCIVLLLLSEGRPEGEESNGFLWMTVIAGLYAVLPAAVALFVAPRSAP